MAATNVTEFLHELNATESLNILQEVQTKKSVLVFKVDGHQDPITCSIESISDKFLVLSDIAKDLNIPKDKEISIKFHIGTEVYFIKTKIQMHLNRYCVDINSKVIHLRRRKFPRFRIPKKWPQSAQIMLTGPLAGLFKGQVIDISESGIRLEIPHTQIMPLFKINEQIRIKFQIYKRAEMQVTVTIKFLTKKTDQLALFGLEFKNLTPIQNEKIANIIDDIGLFSSTNSEI